MPRAGDPWAYSLPKVVAELGYVSCSVVACYIEREYLKGQELINLPEFIARGVTILGSYAWMKSCMFLLLDKLDEEDARDDWRDHRLFLEWCGP